MDLLTALHTRRSIRAYTPAPVSAEDIDTILRAAMTAPSAGNAQPWEFIVVDDPATLARIPAIHPYASMAPKSPVSILACGDTRQEKYPGFWMQDCSAAIQNMLLAVTALKLGAVWTGIYPVQDRVAAFTQLFALPETVIPLGLVVIGHPAKTAEPVARFNEAKIHRNHW